MKLKLLITLLISNMFLLILIGVFGDTIILKEGKEIRCAILSMNQKEVKIESGGVEMCIPRARIKGIKKAEIKPSVSATLTPTPYPAPSTTCPPEVLQPSASPP
ncbi:hypothetical protein J7M23_11760, partial [Candidatus Sumerlaeota bacterium]|nr:hypothetical protein [Candidatus Sumerlaeota bacterium]